MCACTLQRVHEEDGEKKAKKANSILNSKTHHEAAHTHSNLWTLSILTLPPLLLLMLSASAELQLLIILALSLSRYLRHLLLFHISLFVALSTHYLLCSPSPSSSSASSSLASSSSSSPATPQPPPPSTSTTLSQHHFFYREIITKLTDHRSLDQSRYTRSLRLDYNAIKCCKSTLSSPIPSPHPFVSSY